MEASPGAKPMRDGPPTPGGQRSQLYHVDHLKTSPASGDNGDTIAIGDADSRWHQSRSCGDGGRASSARGDAELFPVDDEVDSENGHGDPTPPDLWLDADPVPAAPSDDGTDPGALAAPRTPNGFGAPQAARPLRTGPLSSQQIQKILDARTQHPNWSQHQIAAHVGVSRMSVNKVVSQHNLQPSKGSGVPLSGQRVQKILDARTQHPNWSQQQIAAHVGVSRASVNKVVKQHNLQPSRGSGVRLSDQQEQEILNTYTQHPNWSQRQIATAVNVSQASVNRLFKQHNLQPGKGSGVPLSDQQKQHILDAHTQHPNWSQRQIATHVNVSLASVNRLFKQHNLQSSRGSGVPLSDQQKQHILDARTQHPNWSQRQIATHVGVSPMSVNKVVNQHNLQPSKGSGVPLSDQQKQEILNAHAQQPNSSQRQIAIQFNVSPASVNRLFKQHNLQPGKGSGVPLSDQQKQHILDAQTQHPNWSQRQIATAVNVSQASVNRLFKQHNLQPGKGSGVPLSDQQKQHILDARTQHPNWSQRQIATHVNVSQASVKRVLAAHQARAAAAGVVAQQRSSREAQPGPRTQFALPRTR
ncbi:hypothetical protein [Mycobacterium sp.]|uniref:hypothetical protein n=1 Tax=Mycobacterium sp. TaxID=1785 RepID=UPI003BAD054D